MLHLYGRQGGLGEELKVLTECHERQRPRRQLRFEILHHRRFAVLGRRNVERFHHEQSSRIAVKRGFKLLPQGSIMVIR